MRFTPSSFDGNGPFGQTHGIHTYWYVQENGDRSLSATELQFDYVVVVLNTRIGERTGWMGARGYVDSWDGLDVWQHMGYPVDLNSGQRPVFLNRVTLNGDNSGDDAHQSIQHRADVFPGPVGWADVRLVDRRRGPACSCHAVGRNLRRQLRQWGRRSRPSGGARAYRVA